jgi:hypothetical protein
MYFQEKPPVWAGYIKLVDGGFKEVGNTICLQEGNDEKNYRF